MRFSSTDDGVRTLALKLAFSEVPKRKLEGMTAELTHLLELEFNRVVGLMVAQLFLRKFDELDDLVSNSIATYKFNQLFENAVTAGFTGITIGSPDVSSIVANQKEWGSQLVTGVLKESAKQLNNIIGQGIADGKAREQIANALYRQLGDDGILPPWRARLIAQTEVIRSYNSGARLDKQYLGYTHVKWLDGQPLACPSCSNLHNRIIPLKHYAYFVDDIRGFTVLHPPLHPACRCTIIGATEEEYEAQEAKPLTAPGKPVGVPGVSLQVPAKATAADDFRKWYAQHGDGKTGVAAAQAYAKFKGQPMKQLMDAIKLEGYDVKTLIAHPIGTALPPRNKAIKIPAPGASAKKAAPKGETVTLANLEPAGAPKPAGYWDELELFKPAAGSNPGGFYRHPVTGEKFYIKEYKDIGQGIAEIASLQTFKQLGFTVPTGQIVTRGGKQVYASTLLDDVVPASKASLQAYFDKHPDELIKLHLGAAVTSNWDVFGLSYDNVVFVKGKPAVIDAGGSYTYRAKGGSKSYTSSTGDFDTLMDANINAVSASIFGKLYKTAGDYDTAIQTTHAMILGASKLLDTMPAGMAWGATHISRLKALQDLLVARQGALASVPAGLITPDDLREMAKAFSMASTHKTAVVRYSGSWAYYINNILRTTGKIPDSEYTSVKALDAAMKPTKETVVVYRGIKSLPPGFEMKPGVSFTDAGYMSTSADRNVARNFSGGPSGVTLRIEVPAGTPHVPMNGIYSDHKNEHELLLARGGRVVVTGQDPLTKDWIVTVKYD